MKQVSPSPPLDTLVCLIPKLLFTLTLTQSLSLALVVMMRSKELKTSRSILMLVLSDSLHSCGEWLGV